MNEIVSHKWYTHAYTAGCMRHTTRVWMHMGCVCYTQVTYREGVTEGQPWL